MRKRLKTILLFSLILVWAGLFMARAISSQDTRGSSNSLRASAALMGARAVEEIQDYRTWTRVNPKPANMDAAVARLCAAPVLSRTTQENPHLNKFITVYVNETGRRAMMEELEPKFPTGSVIVKEKLATEDSEKPELLTVMIKREKGFNPQVGDWEFMVTNGAGTEVQSRGKLSSCQACHEMNRSTDFVNRNYLPPELGKTLK